MKSAIRKIFTDYLDDVSTSYPNFNDLLAARGQTAVDFSYRGDEVPGGDPNFPTKDTQRGGAAQKDIYYFTGLNISFRPSFGGVEAVAVAVVALVKKANLVVQLFHSNK